MISWYLSSVFGCGSSSTPNSNVRLTININDETLILPAETVHERYSLSIITPHSWQLTADYYPGFMRGFETFTQLFTQD
jgi:hexosaminidase